MISKAPVGPGSSIPNGIAVFLLLLSTAFPAISETTDDLLLRLDGLLQRNKTVELLDALNGAQDSDALLNWLRTRAEEGHPATQFELGRRLFTTKKREGLSWYLLGNLNLNIDMNLCRDLGKTDPVRRRLREFDFRVSSDEALLWADAVDDSMKLAARHDLGTKGKQPPWWICAPGEASPTDNALQPAEIQKSQRNFIWLTRQANDRDTSREIRMNLNLNPDQFPVRTLEEKYWTGKLNTSWTTTREHGYFSAVWVDNDTLLFGGFFHLTRPKFESVYDPIYKWDLRTGEVVKYADPGFGLCFYKGFVSYYVVRSGRLYYREGNLGREVEVEVSKSSAQVVAPGLDATGARSHCRRVDISLQVKAREWTLESGGKIKREGQFGDSKKTPAEYYPERGTEALKFDPFDGLSDRASAQYWTVYPPSYSEYLDASWLTVVGGRGLEPLPIWILHRSGTIERQFIPPGPWTTGSSYAPVKGGWMAIAASGAYFFDGARVTKILAGNMQGMRVSPNGCRVALAAGLGEGRGTPMSIVNVCEKGERQ